MVELTGGEEAHGIQGELRKFGNLGECASISKEEARTGRGSLPLPGGTLAASRVESEGGSQNQVEDSRGDFEEGDGIRGMMFASAYHPNRCVIC